MAIDPRLEAGWNETQALMESRGLDAPTASRAVGFAQEGMDALPNVGTPQTMGQARTAARRMEESIDMQIRYNRTQDAIGRGQSPGLAAYSTRRDAEAAEAARPGAAATKRRIIQERSARNAQANPGAFGTAPESPLQGAWQNRRTERGLSRAQSRQGQQRVGAARQRREQFNQGNVYQSIAPSDATRDLATLRAEKASTIPTIGRTPSDIGTTTGMPVSDRTMSRGTASRLARSANRDPRFQADSSGKAPRQTTEGILASNAATLGGLSSSEDIVAARIAGRKTLSPTRTVGVAGKRAAQEYARQTRGSTAPREERLSALSQARAKAQEQETERLIKKGTIDRNSPEAVQARKDAGAKTRAFNERERGASAAREKRLGGSVEERLSAQGASRPTKAQKVIRATGRAEQKAMQGGTMKAMNSAHAGRGWAGMAALGVAAIAGVGLVNSMNASKRGKDSSQMYRT